MIKNIVFDLGKVVLKDKPSNILKSMNVIDEDIIDKFFSNWIEVNLGNETLEEHFYNNGLDDKSVDIKTKEILLNYFKYRPFNDKIVDLMNKLKENNYNIYILSNNNNETYEYLKYMPKFKCVDGWGMSCHFHLVKPDKEANINIAKQLGMDGFLLDINDNGFNKLIENMKEFNITI